MAKKSTETNEAPEAGAPIALGVEPPEPATFERTLNAITPLLEGHEIASLTAARVTTLAKAADLHVADVRTLVAAHKMADKVNLPPEVLFALGRDGQVPQAAELGQLAPAEVKEQLESAAKDGTIAPSIVESFGNIKPVLEQLQIEHAPLGKISDQLDLKIPSALIKTLAAKRITTLQEIRKSGGLVNLSGLPTDDQNVKTLDALANLTLVSTDLQTNTELIKNGFSHLLDIAEETPQRFAARTKGVIDPRLAARIYSVASVQARLLTNLMTAMKIEGQFGLGSSGTGVLDQLFPPLCGCDECHDATSPLVYLSDLLNYALRHVRFSGNPIALTDLERRFHQPLRNLPTDCEAMRRPIRQVRLCIEVLRGYLKAQNIAYATPRWYLQTAYARLLEANDTSVDEIRLVAGSQNAVSQNELVDRLMIFPDLQLLDEFTRDPSTGAPAHRALTERWLDEFFGLRDTGRDPVDPGVTPALLRMRHDELRRRWTDQENGLAYLFWIDRTFASDLNNPPLSKGLITRFKAHGRELNPNAGITALASGEWTILDAGNEYLVREQRQLLYVYSTNQPRLLGDRPIVDPDIVDQHDLLDQAQSPRPANKTSWNAADLFAERSGQLILLFDEVKADPQSSSLKGLFGKVSQPSQLQQNHPSIHGIDYTTLLKLRLDRDRGLDIAGSLQALELREDEFDYLSRLVEIDHAGQPILDSEWDDLYNLIIQRIKQYELFPAWIDEERQLNSPGSWHGLTLSPDHFHIRSSGLGPDVSAWVPTPWRSDEAERRQWESILRTRSDQMQSITTAMDAAVDHVESELLSRLRDDLLAAAGPSPGTLGLEKLGQHLQISVRAGTCQMTTRVAQAIETIQGVIFGARNGLLEDNSITIDADHFDEEWKWIGSYATWRAAMLVFLYPENTLRPTLLARKSPAFGALINNLRDIGPSISEDDVRREVVKYERYFRDVSSLSCVGLRLTQGLIQESRVSSSASTISPWWDSGDVLAVGQGGGTGGFYGSTWVRQSGWGLKGSPIQDCWQPITGLADFSELAGLMPLQNDLDLTCLALYFRARLGASYRYQIVNVDGAKFGSPRAINEMPALVCSSQYAHGLIPQSPALAKTKANPWVLHSDDQVVVADLDGDGRSEIILISAILEADGRRRLGLVREWGGGLRLDWEGRIDGSWRIPDPERPILFQISVNRYPWRLLRLFIIDPSRSQIATLGWVDGSLEVINATKTITGSSGNWNVNPGTTNKPTTFVGANLDGNGTKLVAFESQVDPTYKTTKIVAHAMTWQNQSFALLATQDVLAFDDNGSLEIAWQVFLPVRSGYSPSSYQVCGREEILITATHQVASVTSRWVRLLRWDEVKNQFAEGPYDVEYWGESNQYSIKPVSKKIPGIEGQPEWELDNYDEFYPYETGTASAGIIVRSPSRSSIGVLRYQNDGTLGVAWQTSSQIQSASSMVPPWDLESNDRFQTEDINGDGADELIIHRPGGNSPLAICTIGADGTVMVSWRTSGNTVSSPLNLGLEGWPLSEDNRLLMADIDDDGYKEVLVIGTDMVGPRMGILRTIPNPIQRHLQDLPQRFGPVGVSLLNISSKSSYASNAERGQQIKNTYEANRLLDGQGNPIPDSEGNDTYIEQQRLYLDEAYYSVPIELALRLHESGDFTAALDWFRSVYDYDRPTNERMIAYNLVLDAGEPDFERGLDWLQDPLNPHAIARVRKGSYTKFTLLSIVNCLLAEADSEFTRATSESVPRARELYLKALQLLDDPELNQHDTACKDLISTLEIKVGNDEDIWVLDEIKRELLQIGKYWLLEQAVERMRPVLASDLGPARKLARAKTILEKLSDNQPQVATLEEVMREDGRLRRNGASAVLSDGAVLNSLIELEAGDVASIKFALSHWEQIPAPQLTACIPLNRAIQTARDHANLNLHKIRTCRNIAGMEMRLEPYAGTTAMMVSSGDQLPSPEMTSFQPLPYRYATLIERAKQLVDLARQIEASMLNFLEKAEVARYDELKARQDLGLSRAGLRLRELQVNEASANVRLAQLQAGRAEIQKNEYGRLLKQGTSALENASLALLGNAVVLQSGAAAGYLGTGLYLLGLAAFTENPFGVGGAGEALASASNTAAAMLSTTASITSTLASYERRQQEWQFQQAIATQDVTIGQQQIALANERVSIAGQEHAIASLQVDHAQAILDFLANKFFNADLYDWMSNVNEQVYRFFLQQATSIAKLAQQQLAFERQEAVQTFIKADYWERPKQGMSTDVSASGSSGQLTSLHGLTGSARLLRDIYELDQYAFRSNQRKLQLTEMISLAQHDPFAFQQFRETGVLNFAIPQAQFDRKFPGHYLRLLRRVRTSVIALVPPTLGIRATLSSVGTSRTVIGPDQFQEVVVQRGPESVALTSPINATGLFELDVQPELIPPFEGIGVDSAWEFRMPKAANQFDYTTIADMLLTIEYTALDSYDYRQQVIKKLNADRLFTADRAFSFRNEFADAWYDLNNPDLVDAPNKAMTVSVDTVREDFPPNLENLRVRQVVLYFAQVAGRSKKVKVDDLAYTPEPTEKDPNPKPTSLGAAESDEEGVISTRQGRWSGFEAKVGVAGKWTFSLPDKDDPKKRFKGGEVKEKGDIRDILFVITYEGETPQWPD